MKSIYLYWEFIDYEGWYVKYWSLVRARLEVLPHEGRWMIAEWLGGDTDEWKGASQL